MPIEIREHRPDENSPDYFAQVLREQPEQAHALYPGKAGARVIEAIFNARPVGILVALPRAEGGWGTELLVVHPATRGRGVGSTLLAGAARLLGELQPPADMPGLVRRAGL